MVSIKVWDPKNPRKAKNISQDEWLQYEPHVQVYRQNGHTLKEVVDLLREEHDFIISYSQLVARVAKQNGQSNPHHENGDDEVQPSEQEHAVIYDTSNSNLLPTISEELQCEASIVGGWFEGQEGISTAQEDLLASLSAIIGSFSGSLEGSSESTEADNVMWTFKNERLVSLTTLHNNIRPQPFGYDDFGRHLEAVHACYQLADCFAAIGETIDAFHLYYLSMKDTLQIRAIWRRKYKALLQYLLWGLIGLCTTCDKEPKIKLAFECLNRVADSLSQHAYSDMGTRTLLDLYRAHLKGQRLETIEQINFHRMYSSFGAFDSLHPDIRWREAHYLVSIALHRENGSPLPGSGAETFSTVLCELIEMQASLIQQWDLHRETLVVFPAPEWEKILFWIFVREFDVLGDEPMSVCRSPLFLSQYAKYMVEKAFKRKGQGSMRQHHEHGKDMITFLNSACGMITQELVSTYLAELRTRHSVGQADPTSGIYTRINRAFANQLVMQWCLQAYLAPRHPTKHQGITLEQQGSGGETWKCATDNASVSTDTRSFIANSRRINKNLATRRSTNSDSSMGRNNDAYSDTMSMCTNESWQFHRVTGIAEDQELQDELMEDVGVSQLAYGGQWAV